MTTSHLVTNGNLSLLRNVNADSLIYAGCQFVAVFSGKYLCIHYNTIFAVRNL